jgi:hypothetical protein
MPTLFLGNKPIYFAYQIELKKIRDKIRQDAVEEDRELSHEWLNTM